MKRCNAEGCERRAWHGELCNYHALLEARRQREAVQHEKSAREVRERAEDLGLTLDEAAAVVPARKARSPVA